MTLSLTLGVKFSDYVYIFRFIYFAQLTSVKLNKS